MTSIRMLGTCLMGVVLLQYLLGEPAGAQSQSCDAADFAVASVPALPQWSAPCIDTSP